MQYNMSVGKYEIPPSLGLTKTKKNFTVPSVLFKARSHEGPTPPNLQRLRTRFKQETSGMHRLLRYKRLLARPIHVRVERTGLE